MPLARYIKFETQANFTDETFGVSGADSHIIDPVGEDITGDKQFIYPRTAGIRNQRAHIKGKNKFSGTIDAPLYPTHAVSLIYYAMGAVSTTTGTPTTGTNTHIITKANTVPFFRMAIGRDLRQHEYVGGIINSMSVDYTMDDIITGSFDVMFRKELPNEALETSEAFLDFDENERAFGGAESSVTIDASADDRIESFSVTLENNVADDAYSLGSEFLPAGIIAALNVTGSSDMRFDTISEYDAFINETNRAIVLTGAFGSADLTRSVAFDIPVVNYDTNNLPTDNFERYVQTLAWTAEPDSNSDPLIVTVKNAQVAAAFAG